MVKLAGVDLAWQSKRNPTAIAVGELSGDMLQVSAIHENLFTIDAVQSCLLSIQNLDGIAIDAPLIIKNQTGQRQCERDLGKQYSARRASCHTSNLKLYPDPDSVKLSDELAENGFKHLGNPQQQWQIECYPHPAIIEIFGLPERLRYKKGRVAEKREGQKIFAGLLRSLERSTLLELTIPDDLHHFLDDNHIDKLRGKTLKHNEDALDAILCLYIAALYQRGHVESVFGDTSTGYIYVPTITH